MAQFVSMSPQAETVVHIACSKSSRCRAAHQTASGTVSEEIT
jgi:hypothetical protein